MDHTFLYDSSSPPLVLRFLNNNNLCQCSWNGRVKVFRSRVG